MIIMMIMMIIIMIMIIVIIMIMIVIIETAAVYFNVEVVIRNMLRPWWDRLR